jgi:heat shock protein HslJ
MKAALLLLAAAATIGAAPGRPNAPARYTAGSFEPTWSLVIEDGRMTFYSGADEPPVSVALPRRRPVRNGYRYVSRAFTVEVRHVRCDAYNGQTYADTVRVSLAVEEGCGGIAIPPPTLKDYSGWDVFSVGNVRPPPTGQRFRFEFEDREVRINAGCHDYSARYRERRPVLTLGPLRPTRSLCPITAFERRLLDILRGPLRMRWVEGDTLILTGRGGSIRLTP